MQEWKKKEIAGRTLLTRLYGLWNVAQEGDLEIFRPEIGRKPFNFNCPNQRLNFSPMCKGSVPH